MPDDQDVALPEEPTMIYGQRTAAGRPFVFLRGPRQVELLFRRGNEWYGDYDGARAIAWEMLDGLGGHALTGDDDAMIDAFAEEVVLKFPQRSWEISLDDLFKWTKRYHEREWNEGLVWSKSEEELPAEVLGTLPDDVVDGDFEKRVQDKLHELGMLDDAEGV